MFFKPIFKDAILNGTKIATIRKKIHVKEGNIFKIRLGNRFKSEYLCNAKCLFTVIFKIPPHDTTPIAKQTYEVNKVLFGFSDFNILRFVPNSILGGNICNIYDIYKESLPKNENRFEGYLHIFEVIKDKTNLNQNTKGVKI